MTSNELVELLYVAYNRDEAEVYGLDKALKAGYDELYSTAPDVVEKQMRALDREIEEEARITEIDGGTSNTDFNNNGGVA